MIDKMAHLFAKMSMDCTEMYLPPNEGGCTTPKPISKQERAFRKKKKAQAKKNKRKNRR